MMKLNLIMPDDVAEMVTNLHIDYAQSVGGAASRERKIEAADMLERQARHIRDLRELRAIDKQRIEGLEERQMQHDSIDIANAESIEMLQTRIEELEAEPCVVNSYSSRICERGTKCCGVYHESREE